MTQPADSFHEPDEPNEPSDAPWNEILANAQFLRRVSRRIVDGELEAADLEQSVLLRAAESPPVHTSRLKGWLYRVAANLVHEHRRRRASRLRVEHSCDPATSAASGLEIAARIEAQQRVINAVAALDDKYRSVVFHRFYEDRSVAEIAVLLGIPEATVRTRLQRAIAMLREELKGTDGRSGHAWILPLLPVAGFRLEVDLLRLDGLSSGGSHASDWQFLHRIASVSAGSIPTLAVVALVGLVTGLWWFERTAMDDRSSPSKPIEYQATNAADPLPNRQPGTAMASSAIPALPRRAREDLGRVSGRVVQSGEVPERNVTVSLYERVEFPEPVGTPIVVGQSSDDGSFELREVPLRQCWLIAGKPGFSSAYATLDLGEDQRLVTDLRLQVLPARTVRGRVVDSRGKAIAGASWIAFNEDFQIRWLWRQGRTDSSGAFVADLLPRTGVCINVFAEGIGWESSGEMSENADEVTLQVDPGRTARLALKLVDPEGLEIGGARIHLQPGDDKGLVRMPSWLMNRSIEDPAGATFEDLPAKRYEIQLAHPVFRFPLQREVVLGAGTTTELVFKAQSTVRATWTGTLKDEKDQPLKEMVILAEAGQYSVPMRFETGPDGAFSISLATSADGAAYVWLDRSGWRLADACAADGVLQLDAAQLGPITLSARRAPAIEGRVLTPDGEALGGMTVEVHGRSPWRTSMLREQQTDDTGRFCFESIDDTDATLTLRLVARWGETLAIQRLCEVAEGAEIVLEAQGMTRIEGRVLDADGQPLAFEHVSCLSGHCVPSVTDAQGCFVLPEVECGIQTLVFGRRDGSFGRLAHCLEVTPELSAESLSIRLSSEPIDFEEREVKVLREDGSPVCGAKICVLSPDRMQAKFYYSDELGQATMQDPDRGGTIQAIYATPERDLARLEPGEAVGFCASQVEVLDAGTAMLVLRLEESAARHDCVGDLDPEVCALLQELVPLKLTLVGDDSVEFSSTTTMAAIEGGRLWIRNLTAGMYRADCAWAGIRPTSFEFGVPGADQGLGLLPIDKAPRCDLHVVDESAVPVEGARILVGARADHLSFLHTRDLKLDEDGETLFTGPDGRASMLLDGEHATLVLKEGFVPMMTRVPPDSNSLELSLVPAGDVEIQSIPPLLFGGEPWNLRLERTQTAVETEFPSLLCLERERNVPSVLGLYHLPAGCYQLDLWEQSISLARPPASQLPFGAYRFQFQIHRGTTTTLELQ